MTSSFKYCRYNVIRYEKGSQSTNDCRSYIRDSESSESPSTGKAFFPPTVSVYQLLYQSHSWSQIPAALQIEMTMCFQLNEKLIRNVHLQIRIGLMAVLSTTGDRRKIERVVRIISFTASRPEWICFQCHRVVCRIFKMRSLQACAV